MGSSSTLHMAARAFVSTDFEQWKDDLLLRESLVAEAEPTSPAVPLSIGASQYLRKAFDLSPEEFRCLENIVLGRGCGQCPCGRSDALAERGLLQLNIDPQGRRSCTSTAITTFVYETAVMLLQAIAGE